MPWRLVFVVILMGVVIFFVGLNLDNRADISFGFHEFSQVPIFISLFVAFLAGVVVMLPFTLGLRRRRKEKARDKENVKKNRKDAKALPAGDEKKSGVGLFKKKKKEPKSQPAAKVSQGPDTPF